MVPKKKSWVELNVGGKVFVTVFSRFRFLLIDQTKATLVNHPSSLFALMMEVEEKESQEKFSELDDFDKEVVMLIYCDLLIEITTAIE